MAFKMKKSSYKMGGTKTKDTMAYMKSPLEAAKPDYIDIDKDGDTTESMKEASMAKMKSPLEAQGIYKTGPGGSIEQISQEEYDNDSEFEEGYGHIVTGNDHLKQVEEGNFYDDEGMADLKKRSDKFTKGSYEMKGDGSQRRAVAMDDEIQRKINAEEPLTEREEMFQARALKNVNR